MAGNRSQRIRADVVERLQELFYVTDGELVAQKLDPMWLTPNDVVSQMQAQYGVLLPPQEYKSWGEFVNIMSRAVCRLRLSIK